MASSESELQWALLRAAPAALPDLRFFRRNVGTVRVGGRVMRFGVAGQCDLWGVWRGGQLVEVELKAEKGRLSPQQAAWASFCDEWGIAWLCLRAAPGEAPDATVRRWLTKIEMTRILTSSTAST